TFDPDRAVNAANVMSNSINFDYDHGFETGDAVVYSARGSETPIAELSDGVTYYVVRDSARTIQLAASYDPDTQDTSEPLPISYSGAANETQSIDFATKLQLAPSALDAVSPDPVVLDIDGSGITGLDHRMAPQTAASGGLVFDPTRNDVLDSEADSIDFGFVHGLEDGDAIAYDNGGGTPPSGLHNGTVYYADVQDETTIQVRERLYFDPDVGVESNQITLIGHGLVDDQLVTYRNSPTGEVGGLSADTDYYVVNSTTNTIQLAGTEGGAAIVLTKLTLGDDPDAVDQPIETLHAIERTVDLDNAVAVGAGHRFTLAGDVEESRLAPGALVIRAAGEDANRADTVAGKGFSLVMTFAAADSETKNKAGTTAAIGENATGQIRVNSVAISADHTAEFNHGADGTSIALLGAGSYPSAESEVKADVSAVIGAGVDLRSGSLDVSAVNRIVKPDIDEDSVFSDQSGDRDFADLDRNVQGVGGGLIAATAAPESTSKTYTTANVVIGDGAQLVVGGDTENSGAFRLNAENEVIAYDEAGVHVGAVIGSKGWADSKLISEADAHVVVGDATLESVGDIKLGTR
ncbi:MAG: hypothetical protein GY741_04960, partial [Phycisphaeraceae bacterium]|nr:hypothetical protein [Phycisphaeraceae bacterium]